MIEADELIANLRPLLRQQIGEAPKGFRAVRIDSREVRPDDLFAALPGEHHDGHDFLDDAVAHGASGLLAQRPPATPPPGVVTYVVSDTLNALQTLAAGHRRRQPAKVIGVTGSVGKTTTKEMTAAILRRRYRVLKNEANYNNEIGLPMTLLKLSPRHERAVLEMGMYAPGEIRLLCELAQPEVGVVTNVGPVHLERLGSIAAIAAAKRELVEALPKEGVAILNGDDPLVRPMAGRTRARVLLYGTSSDCSVRGSDLDSQGLRGISFTLACGQRQVRVKTRLPGRHLLYNALAAAAVGLTEGMTPAELAEALAESRVPLRLRVYRGRNDSTILDDTYNASPASVLAALELLADLPGRRIAVLGDMRELGTEEKEGHRVVGREAARVAQVIYAIGDLGRLIGEEALRAGHPAVSLWTSKEEAARDLASNLAVGDVVLLKASRALALETMLEELRG